MMDLHCHIDLYDNPEKIVEECIRRNLYVLSITNTPSAWRKTNEIAQGAKRIKTALGLHPLLAKERMFELPLFDELFEKTRYIGEIGLDGSKEYLDFWEDQKTVFNHILSRCDASLEQKILSIHSRNAGKEVIECISQFPNVGKIILHWYSDKISTLEKAIAMGCWFSVNPIMLKSNNGNKIVAMIPKSKILLETDGPFTNIKNKCLYPWDVDLALKDLSILWDIPQKGVETQIYQNFQELLAI